MKQSHEFSAHEVEAKEPMRPMSMNYPSKCAPQALAAIAGKSAHDIADELHQLKCALGREMGLNTVVMDMHRWLFDSGFTVEPWDLAADAPGDADQYAVKVRTRHPCGPLPVYNSMADARVAILNEYSPHLRARIESALNERMNKRPRLREWAAGHVVGTFLVHVDEHCLAFRDGRIIAGDDIELSQYGAYPVVRAVRVSRPDNKPRANAGAPLQSPQEAV